MFEMINNSWSCEGEKNICILKPHYNNLKHAQRTNTHKKGTIKIDLFYGSIEQSIKITFALASFRLSCVHSTEGVSNFKFATF